MLHIVGGVDRFLALLSEPAVAIVGARRPSPYGVNVARSLGRGLGAAGVTVVSGMARGIDTAAHRGALDAVAAPTPGAPTPGASTPGRLPPGRLPPGRLPRGAYHCRPRRSGRDPYPASARTLHGRIGAAGAIVSELPPGTTARRWMFPARNRIIAGLSAMTVVVEARERSGALLTAGHAAGLGRPLGAVPGRVTSPLTWGPHALLRAGARLVTGPERARGVFRPDAPPPAAASDHARGGGQPALEPRLQALLDALAEGHATATALVHAGLDADDGLAALAALELGGRIRRAGGRALRGAGLVITASADAPHPT